MLLYREDSWIWTRKKTSELEKTKSELLNITAERDIAINNVKDIIETTAEAMAKKILSGNATIVNNVKELISETAGTVLVASKSD